MVTIKDISKMCNVSPTAVSLVLNNRPNRISPQKRMEILQAAETLSYRPNQLAVGLVTKTTKTIGLIIPDIRNIFFSELAHSIEVCAREQDYLVFYSESFDNSENDYKYTEEFIGRGVDGILLVSAFNTTEPQSKKLTGLLEDSGKPCVFIDRFFEGIPIHSISSNHIYGAYVATKHLIMLGHKKIANLCGPKNEGVTERRLDGYKKALSEYSIPFDEEILFYGNFRADCAAEALPIFIDKDVTAIFCHNDYMALGIYKNIVKYSLRIPEDISIVSFDNTFICDIIDPPLTSVDQDINRLGSRSFEHLHSLIKGDASLERKETLLPSLLVRKSTQRNR